MVVIGLTGGIASGKSTVSRILKELGAEIVDADLVAKEVVRPNTDAWRELVSEFGRGILNPDKTINRRKLGNMVFPDKTALAKLNHITHPRILKRITERIAQARQAGIRVLVLDAPLLIESGTVSMADQVWVVAVDQETQLTRLMARDHFTFQEALNRLNSQMPLAEKIKYATVVIDNSGSLEETRARITGLWEKIVSE
ncbi:MAG: dephospho-CoA kinase [Actinobacteria bacterium]|nr:dephospho-CoA kinase [Actinomycetota bacterium]